MLSAQTLTQRGLLVKLNGVSETLSSFRRVHEAIARCYFIAVRTVLRGYGLVAARVLSLSCISHLLQVLIEEEKNVAAL